MLFVAPAGSLKRQQTSQVAGSVAVTIAAMALIGWWAKLPMLSSWGAGFAPTKPVTALCLTALGLALIHPGKNMRVAFAIGLAVAAIAAPLLLFCAYAGFRIVDAQLRDDLEDLTTETRTLSAAVDREIIGEIERLQALAASPSLRQGDFAEFQRQAEASLALRQSGNIMLIDRNMQQIVNTWVPFGAHLEKAAVPEPAQMALATGRPQVTGLFMGPVVKQLLIGIIVPVKIEGESRYALVRSPNPHALAGLVAANQLPPGWHAVVSDATHRVIVGSQDAFIGQELPPTQRHRAGSGGVFEFTDSEGRPSLQAYAWSELTGWQTAVSVPKALLQAPVQALWWSLGYIALLAFAIVVTLALWLGLIIARSIGHAARAAIASGEDGPVLPSETPVAEVNSLMAELRERTDLLRDSERQLRLVTDNVRVAIAR